MKKSTLKIVGLVALLALGGGLAYHRFGMMKKKPSETPSTSSELVKGTTPTEFSISDKTDSNYYVKFWTDGKRYLQQQMGPNIKSAPQEISEADFIKSYSAWKA